MAQSESVAMVSRLFGLFRRRGMDDECEHVRTRSSDYIDGDLDEASADMVRSHLAWCPGCSAFVKTLTATVSLLRATPKRLAPDGFRQRVRESVRRSASR